MFHYLNVLNVFLFFFFQKRNQIPKLTGFWHRMSTSGEEIDVICQRVADKGIITLNRPNVLNALNLSMIRKIYPQMLVGFLIFFFCYGHRVVSSFLHIFPSTFNKVFLSVMKCKLIQTLNANIQGLISKQKEMFMPVSFLKVEIKSNSVD